MFFNPKHIIIKLIAIIVCTCFLWQDVVWAAGSDFRASTNHLRQKQIRQQLEDDEVTPAGNGRANSAPAAGIEWELEKPNTLYQQAIREVLEDIDNLGRVCEGLNIAVDEIKGITIKDSHSYADFDNLADHCSERCWMAYEVTIFLKEGQHKQLTAEVLRPESIDFSREARTQEIENDNRVYGKKELVERDIIPNRYLLAHHKRNGEDVVVKISQYVAHQPALISNVFALAKAREFWLNSAEDEADRFIPQDLGPADIHFFMMPDGSVDARIVRVSFVEKTSAGKLKRQLRQLGESLTIAKTSVKTASGHPTRRSATAGAAGAIGVDLHNKRDRAAFPVTKVDAVINSDTGWASAKREEGKRVATAGINIADLGLAPLEIEDDFGEVDSNTAYGYAQRGAAILAGYVQSGNLNEIFQNPALPGQIPVEFMQDHDAVVDILPLSADIQETLQAIRFDTDIPAKVAEEHKLGLEVLYALGIYHELAHIIGLDEHQAIAATLQLYETLSDEHKAALEKLLEQPFIDSGNIFLAFLKNAAGKEGLERARWITWLVGQTRKDYAYDANAVRDCLARHAATEAGIYSDACKAELVAIIGKTYNEEREVANVTRLAQEARQRGQQVLFERFGHVGHILGSLFAASKVVTSFEELVEVCRGIDGLVEAQGRDAELPINLLMPAVNRLLRLAQRQGVTTEAQLRRAVNLYERAVKEFRTEAESVIKKTEIEGLAAIDREVNLPAERQKKQQELRGQLDQMRANLRTALSLLEDATTDLRFAIQNSPKRDALYVFMMQRISRTGTPNIAYINELEKAYAGPGYGTEEVVASGGHNVHATASYTALEMCDHAVESLPLFIVERDGKTYIEHDAMEQTIRSMAEYWLRNIESASREGRQMPTLSVVTTQSYGMTRLISYWLEEEMANYRLVRDRGWDTEVEGVVRSYQNEIMAALEQAIEEEELGIEVEENMESKGMSRPRAMRAIMDLYADVSEAVPVIAVVNKFAEALNPVIQEIRAAHPELSPHQARCEALRQFRIDTATGKVVRIEEGYDGRTLFDLAAGFMRSCNDLAFSTARKEVIARHMFNGEITQLDLEGAWISCRGDKKGYNLAYTSSRINLGPGQIDSVVDLGQPVGPFDEQAAIASGGLYEYINYSREGVQVTLNPEGTEGHKTLENSISRDCLYALGNVVALTAQSVDNADARDMIRMMNLRGEGSHDRVILPPGEGYGGFCIPKEGLFVDWVQSLTDAEVLRHMGVPEQDIPIIQAIAREALIKKADFASLQEWQDYVKERLGQYLKNIDRPIYVVNIDRATQVLERLGEPQGPEAQFLRKAGLFGTERTILASREVNNFMPYFKVVLILRALARLGKPVQEARIGIQACYKPDVQDSRLATAWDIFCGLAGSTRRLDNMQAAVRELALEGRGLYPAVREVRLVDPLMTRDGWGSHSGEFKQVAGNVTRVLLDATDEQGRPVMTEPQMQAAIKAYGADVDRWPMLKAHPQLRDRVRSDIYILVAYVNDIEPDVWRGIEGLDVLNLGIPHQEIKDMLDNLPAVAQGMRKGNSDSALILADGPAGAEPRVMDEDMAMEWMSLGGTFIDIGTPDGIIAAWRQQMEKHRDPAARLNKQISAGERDAAEATFKELSSLVTERFIETYERMETEARRARRTTLSRKYSLMLSVFHRVNLGINLSELDFATWLALGGRYVLAGVTPDEIQAAKQAFEEKIAPSAASARGAAGELEGLLAAGKIPYDEIVTAVQEAAAKPPRAGALKGAAETKAQARDAAEERRQKIDRSRALKTRIAGFESVSETGNNIDARYNSAMQVLASPTDEVSQENFGRFLAYAGAGIKGLAEEIRTVALEAVDMWEAGHIQDTDIDAVKEKARNDAAAERQRIGKELDDLAASVTKVFSGREISGSDYAKLGGKKGRLDLLATLAKSDKALLEKVAKALAMTDMAYAIELTTQAQSEEDVWKALALFYDASLNCHIFDYMPYTLSVNAVYTKTYSREELFTIFERYYTWLYDYAVNQLKTRTELAQADPDYVNNLFTMAIQANTPGERFCYNYARPRDLAYQIFDLRLLFNDPLWNPQVLTGVDPVNLGCVTKDAKDVTAGRPSTAIMYPFGNTTVAIHATYAGKQHPGMNLFISPFVNAEEINVPNSDENPDGKQTVFTMKQGMVYLTEEEFIACGGDRKILDERNARGVSVDTPVAAFIEFTEPILLSCIAPHFKHPFYKQGAFRNAKMAVSWEGPVEELSYDKTVQPDMLKNTDIDYPRQVNWYQSDTGTDTFLDAQDAIRNRILNDLPERTTHIIIKPANESGGRGIVICRVRNNDGTIYEGDSKTKGGLMEAIEAIYSISKRDDAVIQEFLNTSPRGIVTDEFYNEIVRRFIMRDDSVGITDETPLYSCYRTIISQGRPGDKPEITAWIQLIATEPTSNFGQGALMFELRPENIRPEYREKVMAKMQAYAEQMIQAYEDYAPKYAVGHDILMGADLAGVSYARPTSLLLDWMISPVFNDKGEIVDVRVSTIEQNIGYGQFYPHNEQLPEERKGEGVDALVEDLADRGVLYLAALQAIREGKPVPPVVGTDAAAAAAAGLDNTIIKGFETLGEITPGLTLQSINIDNVSSVLIMALHDVLQEDIEEIQALDVMPTYPDMRSMLERRAKGKIKQWESDGLCDVLAAKFPGLGSQKEIVSTVLQDDDYITAVAIRGAEAALTTSIYTAWQSPVLQISPQPLDPAEINDILGDRPNMVIVAGYLGDLFQDEVYALSTDAVDGGMNTNVLGVLESWLTDDTKAVTRAVLVDSNGIFREVSFAKPVPVDIACILHHQIGEEQYAHQRLSNRFEDAGIQQVNPYEAARQVDSKWLSIISWTKAGLPAPKTQRIALGTSIEDITAAIDGFSSVVVKPEHGTEGIYVELFQQDSRVAAAEHINRILRSGDNAFIQERRGNIFYVDPRQPELGPREVTLRVNVEWDGTRYVANAGFAQVAAEKGAFPASRGRSGSVKDINWVLANMTFVNPGTGEEQRLVFSGSDIDAIVACAIRATEALYDKLSVDKKPKLVGIDMVLEKSTTGEVTSVLLEGNSRPAGLANSTVIKRPGDLQEVEHRATTAIWKWAAQTKATGAPKLQRPVLARNEQEAWMPTSNVAAVCEYPTGVRVGDVDVIFGKPFLPDPNKITITFPDIPNLNNAEGEEPDAAKVFYGPYSEGALLALQRIDLQGKTVLVLGSGIGTQAFAAVKLGAKTVVGFESIPELVERAAGYAADNGVSNTVRFLQCDFTKTSLRDTGVAGVDILIINLGDFAVGSLDLILRNFNPAQVIISGGAEEFSATNNTDDIRDFLINRFDTVDEIGLRYQEQEQARWAMIEGVVIPSIICPTLIAGKKTAAAAGFGSYAGAVGIEIWQWAVQNPGPSGLADWLQKTYKPEHIEEHLTRLRKLIDKAIEVGVKGLCVIERAPGRCRVFGGHTDGRGVYGWTVNSAIDPEIDILLAKRTDRKISAVNVGKQIYPSMEFGTDEGDLKPDINKGWRQWTTDIIEVKKDRLRQEIATAKNVTPDKVINEEVDSKWETTRDAKWYEFVKGAYAYMIRKYGNNLVWSQQLQKEVPLKDELSEGFDVVAYGNIPSGGFSSSSAFNVAMARAINDTYGLGLSDEEIIEAGEIEAYTAVHFGNADEMAIVQSQRGKVLLGRSSSPGSSESDVIVGDVVFPPELKVIYASVGFGRNDVAEYSERVKNATEIINLTGAGGELGVMWIKHKHPEYAERLDKGLREFVQGSLADIGFARIYQLLKEIPLSITREKLLFEMPEFINEMDVLFKRHTEPEGGYMLRANIAYLLAENARVLRYVKAVNDSDISTVLQLVKAANDGDRITVYDPQTQTHTDWDPNVGIRDADLDYLIDVCQQPDNYSAEVLEGAKLEWLRGNYQRNSEPVEEMTDIVDKEMGDVAQGRVQAAGFAGFVTFHIWDKDGTNVERLKQLLNKRYYVPRGFKPNYIEVEPSQSANMVELSSDAAAAGTSTVLAKVKAIGDAAIVIEPNEVVRNKLIHGLAPYGFTQVVGFADMESAAAGIQQIKSAGNSVGLVVNNTGTTFSGAIAASIGNAAVVEVPNPNELQKVILDSSA